MLKLSEASLFFDRTPVLDAYSGAQVCVGQVDPYDDSKRDAGAAYRRVLSVAPGTALPAHGALRVQGVEWLVGRRERDGLEELHRDKYVLQPVDALYKVSRLSGFLSGASVSEVYAAPEWVKAGKEAESSSDVLAMFNVYVAGSVDVRPHDVLWSGSSAYLVMSVQNMPAGLRVAYSARMEYALGPATVTDRAYDPVAGEYTAGSTAVVSAVRARWQTLFEYAGQIAERYQEGDDVLVLPAGTALSTASLVQHGGVDWAVLGVDDLGGAVTAHVRPL